MNPSVLIVLISKDHVRREWTEAVAAQEYDNTRTIISIIKPVDLVPELMKEENMTLPIAQGINLYKGCAENREFARQLALNVTADYYLFLDEDVIIPPDTISKLVAEKKEIIAGWYPIQSRPEWVAGKFTEDKKLEQFRRVQPGVIEVNLLGMGCAMFSRKALSCIFFEHGTDIVLEDTLGRKLIVGECAALGLQAYDRKLPMFLHGDVICTHLK